jgi:uracil-DNA glycosylase family 4
MPVAGKGKRKILVVGEGPGRDEDQQGIPFVGKSGRHLQNTMDKYGVDLFEDCWVTNAVSCRPSTADGKNRTPSEKEVGYCQPKVAQVLQDYKPEIVVLLGGISVDSVIGWLWKDQVGDISRWVGFNIPYRRMNCWICPCYHPSFVIRQDERDRQEGLRIMFFEEQIKGALSLKGRPWPEGRKGPEKSVFRIKNPKEAAEVILRMVDKEHFVSFDYETDRLKPDHPNARILCCSISDGKKSYAYPWQGEAVEATREFLQSDTPKIGFNCKFEDRWTRREFGFGVRNWYWDGMIAAHIIDNRKAITGLKFQAFATLGEDSYEEVIKPYMASKGDNDRNRLHLFPLDRMLLYCGIDSLLEHRLAIHQMEHMGVLHG